MASAHKNTCVSDPRITAEPPSGVALGADGDVPGPESLLQEYKELRERFQRTTNALASAAHDLKTPLSILNGYVELLHSEKLVAEEVAPALGWRPRRDKAQVAETGSVA